MIMTPNGKQWSSWLDHISKRVCAVPGVTAEVHEPQGLSNRSPGLSIHWDTTKLGITGAEVSDILYNTEPRIALNAGGGRRAKSSASTQTGVSITAYVMSPGDEKVVADKLYAVLSQPHPPKPPEQPKPPASDLTGKWNVHIDFVSGSAEQEPKRFTLQALLGRSGLITYPLKMTPSTKARTPPAIRSPETISVIGSNSGGAFPSS